MGFFGLLWNNIQKAYLPTISIPGQIVFLILAQLCSDYSKQILLNLTQFITLGSESNLEGFVWSHRNKTGLRSVSETICPAMLVFGKQAFQMFFFQNISTNPIISYDVITLERYCSGEVAKFLAFRFLLSALRYSCSYCLNQICF